MQKTSACHGVFALAAALALVACASVDAVHVRSPAHASAPLRGAANLKAVPCSHALNLRGGGNENPFAAFAGSEDDEDEVGVASRIISRNLVAGLLLDSARKAACPWGGKCWRALSHAC